MKDIELSVSELLDRYRNKVDKGQVVAALRTQAELLNRDESWVVPRENLDYDPDDLNDPRANPLNVRPAPKGATRADEATAPEPDSLGNIADRKAAEAAVDDEDVGDDVPPADQDAVRAKKGMEKSESQFGKAGETYDPTSVRREGHTEDDAKKKK